MNSIEKSQAVLIIFSIVFIVGVFFLVYEKKVEVRHMKVWLAFSFFFIVISFFPSVLKGIIHILDLSLPIYGVFSIFIIFLTCLSIEHHIQNVKEEEDIKRIIQELSILKKKEELENKRERSG